MLVRFTLENWMSFHQPVEFSMVASREKQHSERVPRVEKYQTRLLPLAAIYGGNASGKTNFFKALNFVKHLVVTGTKPGGLIPLEPFRLDTQSSEKPSRFEFEILVDETIYAFSFSATRKAIREEKLVEISSTTERVLYHRQSDRLEFHKSLNDDLFLQFAFQGTRSNQLFLTNSVSQNITKFKPVYDWFEDTLELVAPDSRFEPFEEFLEEDNPLFSIMNEVLPSLDTGIAHIGGEDVSFDSLSIPSSLKNKLEEGVDSDQAVRLVAPNNNRFLITRKGGELSARKLVTYHKMPDGSESKFEVNEESDGTQRIIDLLPVFLEISKSESSKVYVVDEIDRSLHTLLTRKLLTSYLENCSKDTRSQLLLTTHDALLLDQSLFRRDEMWVTERDASGSSLLHSFSEYKDVRYDKDIRKSYLQGRLGGIPNLVMSSNFFEANESNEASSEN